MTRIAPAYVMPKALIQQRLLVTIPRRGQSKPTKELRLRDIAEHTGVGLSVLAACAHKGREVDDSLQLQLSYFFELFDRGLLVKVLEGDRYVIRRIPPKPGVVEPPRAKVDLSWGATLIKWSHQNGNN